MQSASANRIQPSARHRRQVFWQILFPVIAAALACVFVVAVLTVSSVNGSSAAGQWASISTIWLVVPLMAIGVIFAITLTGLIFLLSRLIRNLPTYTHLIHVYFQIINVRLDIILNQVSQPQIGVISRWAAWRAFWRSLWHARKSL